MSVYDKLKELNITLAAPATPAPKPRKRATKAAPAKTDPAA